MLDGFQDIRVAASEEDEGASPVAEITFGLDTPAGTERDDYDFEVKMYDEDEPDFLGFKGHGLRVLGTGKLADETEFSFELPIETVAMATEWVVEDQQEILEINPKATRPQFKEVEVDFGAAIFGEGFTGDADALGPIVADKVKAGLLEVYDEIWSGNVDKLAVMPVESFLPMILLRYVIGFARKMDITKQNLDFGFDPEMLLENVRPTPKKKLELLKEINSEFTEAEEDENPKFVQLILDENTINTMIMDFVLVERAFSLRSFFKSDPKFAEFLTQMTTDNIALLMPEFGEEFGPDKAVDLYFSLSHSLIEKKIADPKPSGFQVDKNGNFRFILNFSVTILVEKTGFRGEWVEARSMYTSVVAKGKLAVKERGDD